MPTGCVLLCYIKTVIMSRKETVLLFLSWFQAKLLMVSAEWLKPTDKVLIIDDFLANGEALRGLCEIVSSAGAELVGMGVAVEKGFQPGGKKLRDAGIPLYSLAIIEKADGNGIVFRDGQEEK